MTTTDDIRRRVRTFRSTFAMVALANTGCQVMAYDPFGTLTTTAWTLAGTGEPAFRDGPGGVEGAAAFSAPRGLAVDANGVTYVCDSANGRIRRIDSQGNVTTLAGTGVLGEEDGPGTAAAFSLPRGVAAAGDSLWVADSGLQYDTWTCGAGGGCVRVGFGGHRIRRVARGGNVSTVAGGVPGYADGPGAAARFDWPAAIAADALGNLYVADTYNNRVRLIDASGVVTTLAGSGAGVDVDGVGTEAGIAEPSMIAVDGQGTVYVGNGSRLRKIDVHLNVSTLVSGGDPIEAVATMPDGAPVLVTRVSGLSHPRLLRFKTGRWEAIDILENNFVDGTPGIWLGEGAGLAVDGAGSIFLSSTFANRVVVISPGAWDSL